MTVLDNEIRIFNLDQQDFQKGEKDNLGIEHEKAGKKGKEDIHRQIGIDNKLEQAHPFVQILFCNQFSKDIAPQEEYLQCEGDGAEIEKFRCMMLHHGQADPQAVVSHEDEDGHDLFFRQSQSTQSHGQVGPYC